MGLLIGAAFWGYSADIIGRRIAFNTGFFICALFVIIAGGMPNYISFAAMYVSASQRIMDTIIDATNLIEFLPATFAWLVTFLAVWWAVGYTITRLLA